jgi:molybdopterin converting factor small subunit
MQDDTVDCLLPVLDIKKEDVGILIVSGKEAGWGQKLYENDVVTLIPHIGGG